VNATTGAFVLLNLILITVSSLYFMYRVYKQNKFLSPSLKKELGFEEQVPTEVSKSLLQANSESMENDFRSGRQRVIKDNKQAAIELSASKQRKSRIDEDSDDEVDHNQIEVPFDDEEEEDEMDEQQNQPPTQLSKKQRDLPQVNASTSSQKYFSQDQNPNERSRHSNLNKSAKSGKSKQAEDDADYGEEYGEYDEEQDGAVSEPEQAQNTSIKQAARNVPTSSGPSKNGKGTVSH